MARPAGRSGRAVDERVVGQRRASRPAVGAGVVRAGRSTTVGNIRRGGAVLAALALTLGLTPAAVGQDCDVRGVVETPPDNAAVTEANVVISGWAADLSATSGNGVTAVRIALDLDPEEG